MQPKYMVDLGSWTVNLAGRSGSDCAAGCRSIWECTKLGEVVSAGAAPEVRVTIALAKENVHKASDLGNRDSQGRAGQCGEGCAICSQIWNFSGDFIAGDAGIGAQVCEV